MKKVVFLLLALYAFQVSAQSNWTVINTGVSFILTDISFPGNQDSIGYAVGMSSTYNGNGVILKTTDAGNTWNQISTGTMPGLEALAFTSVDTGYIGGWQNYFAKTVNGGLTWTTSTVNSSIWYITGIEFYDAQNGIVTAAGSQAYVTTNAGQTWTVASGLAVNAYDIDYASANVVYAVGGDEKIARSIDGGLNWTTIYSGIFQLVFLGVDFYDLNHGIIGGEDGKVLRTSNGGQTWQTSYAGAGYHLLRAAHMLDTSNAIIAGTPEGIFITDNGGATWTSDFSGGNTFAIYKGDFNASGAGFLCGSQGRIFKKNPPIEVNFSASNTFSCKPDSFYFADQSSGGIDIWLWSFPGGNPSQHNGPTPPAIYYGAPGSYDVQLIIISGSQSDTLLVNNAVEVEMPHIFSVAGMNAIDIAANNGSNYSTDSLFGYSYTWFINPMATIGTPNAHQTWIQFQDTGHYELWVETESPNGCKDSSSVLNIIVTNTISLAEIQKELEIHPNPVAHSLVLSNMKYGIIDYRIVDLKGVLVSAGKSEGVIDFSTLPQGVYILELVSPESVSRHRVIKK